MATLKITSSHKYRQIKFYVYTGFHTKNKCLTLHKKALWTEKPPEFFLIHVRNELSWIDIFKIFFIRLPQKNFNQRKRRQNISEQNGAAISGWPSPSSTSACGWSPWSARPRGREHPNLERKRPSIEKGSQRQI